MDIIGTILWPIKWVIELILVGFHTLWSSIGLDPDAGITWVLSIVGLVLIVRAALISATAQAVVVGSRLVVLDLTDCDFVDLVGYRMLWEIARTAETSGVPLQAVGAPASVVRVITLLDGMSAGDVGARVAMDAGAEAPAPPFVGSAPS